MNGSHYGARSRSNAIVMALCYAATAFGLAFLALIDGDRPSGRYRASELVGAEVSA